MHAAIGLTMGMYLFGLVMIVLNLAAFGVGINFITPAGGSAEQSPLNPRVVEKNF